MTSWEYAERTRISSILRSIKFDLSPRPVIPVNSSSANLNLDLLGVSPPPPPPCLPPPRLLLY